MKCYRTVLKIKKLINNYGFFIFVFIIKLYLLTIIIFCICSYNKLKTDIYNILYALICTETLKNKNEIIKKAKKPINKKFKSKIRQKNISKRSIDNKSTNSGQMITLGNYNHNNIVRIKKLLELKDFELDSLNYKDALKLDHRNYCQFYISLLKNNHPLIFSFSCFNDYNSKIIKIFLFFFSFNLDLAINALFFNDDTMHKIYEDKGKFNLLYQLPQIIYSTLIGRVIDSIIRYFALPQDNVVEFKQQKNKKNLQSKYKNLLYIIKIKIIIFFVISFLVVIFLGYYIICFCGIYINTQSHLINDSIISLITSIFYPFAMNIIPGIFRSISLRVKRPTRGYLYRFSMALS